MTDTSATALTLSTEQFLQAIRDLRPATAVFDFDGTLWPGDAGSGFMQWSIETGLLRDTAATHILQRHASYHRGEVDEITICGEMVQIYRGLTEAALRKSAQHYFQEHVQPRFFPEMVSLVHDLQAAGTEIWAVSSTTNWVIEEGVRQMGIPPGCVLAACVSIVEGTATDTLIDVPSDEGKAAALRRVGLTRPDAVFGNSVHDLAMLEMARTPFPVNPTPALADVCRRRGWAMYYPEAR